MEYNIRTTLETVLSKKNKKLDCAIPTKSQKQALKLGQHELPQSIIIFPRTLLRIELQLLT